MSSESSASVDTAACARAVGRSTGELVRWVAATSAGLLLLAALVLCWRRVNGELDRPLALPFLTIVAASVAAAVAAGRMAWRYQLRRRRAAGADWIVPAILSAAVLAWGASVSLPGTAQSGLLLLWGILAVEELWAWRPTTWRRPRFGASAGGATKRGIRVDPPRAAVPHPFPVAASSGHPPTGDVLQQLTRCRTAGGGEVISGWIRVPLAVGQRSANVHVAFCPLFNRTPKASVEQIEGPVARIKTGQLFPWGARFDLKLSSPTEGPETVLLQFSAKAEPPMPGTDA